MKEGEKMEREDLNLWGFVSMIQGICDETYESDELSVLGWVYI